jgi:hypothetical protein
MQTAAEIEREGLSWETITAVWPHIIDRLARCPFCEAKPEPHGCSRSDMVIRDYLKERQ